MIEPEEHLELESALRVLHGWFGTEVEVSVGGAGPYVEDWGEPSEVARFGGRLIRGAELEESEHPYADEAYKFIVGDRADQGFVIHREVFVGAYVITETVLSLTLSHLRLFVVCLE